MSTQPIEVPAGYVPLEAIAFAGPDGGAVRVSAGSALPVTSVAPAAGMPLTGTATGAVTAGPFTPVDDRAIWLSLAGDWTGSVSVLRAVDGGPALPLSVGGQRWARFTGNAQEPVASDAVAGARYFLDVSVTSGTLTYRVQQ